MEMSHSISLTAFSSLISIVSVPYIVFLSIELFDISHVEREISMFDIKNVF